jgi:hypothetical protein
MPKPNNIPNDVVIQRWDQVLSGNSYNFLEWGCIMVHCEDAIKEFVNHANSLVTASSRNKWYAIPAVNAALHVGRQEIQRGLEVVRPDPRDQYCRIGETYEDKVYRVKRNACHLAEKKLRKAYENMYHACRDANLATMMAPTEESTCHDNAKGCGRGGRANDGGGRGRGRRDNDEVRELRKQVAELTRMVASMAK